MNSKADKIYPLGVDALTIDFGNEISLELNERVVSLAEFFEEKAFPGLREIVPAYSSLTLFYDVVEIRKAFPEAKTAFEVVKSFAESALQKSGASKKTNQRSIEIPVDFGATSALDIDFVAAHNNLSKERVIELFTAETYRVYMLGFMPAFAYMGEVDASIAAPRKKSPRTLVPRGSVGIAGRQTGIYPFDSPGGWQIIGKTDFQLFTPEAENPCSLKAGDLVKFYAADK
jgi:inhibitor of KinA